MINSVIMIPNELPRSSSCFSSVPELDESDVTFSGVLSVVDEYPDPAPLVEDSVETESSLSAVTNPSDPPLEPPVSPEELPPSLPDPESDPESSVSPVEHPGFTQKFAEIGVPAQFALRVYVPELNPAGIVYDEVYSLLESDVPWSAQNP